MVESRRALSAVNPSDPDEVQPKPTENSVEVGVGLNLPFSAPYRDNHSVEILRVEGFDAPTPRQLQAMRRTDGQARALFRLVTFPIRSALKSCKFVPEDGGEAEAKFIEQMFTLPPSAGGMTVTLQTFISQLLLGVFDGFAAFEQVYWAPQRGPLKGKWTLKKLAHRPSETVTFLADKNGGFAGLRQQATFSGQAIDVKIESENAFYWAANEEERKFYGVSFFESAFYHFDKKVKVYYLAHLAAQRAATGTRVGKLPKGVTTGPDVAKFEKALADLGVAQWISLPDGYTVESLKEGSTFEFISWVNHHNSQMSKSVMAAFFDANQGGGSADTSLVNFGEQSDAMFILMLQTIMDEIAQAINHYIIPKFIDWNFGSGKYPKFQWGTFTDEQKRAVQATFEKLATVPSAAVTPQFMFALEEYMADQLDLEIDYKEIRKQKEEDWEANREDAQFQRDAQRQAMEQSLAAAAPGSSGPPEPQLDEDGNPIPPDPEADLAATHLEEDLLTLAAEMEKAAQAASGTAPEPVGASAGGSGQSG